jgi:hypothetical protein
MTLEGSLKQQHKHFFYDFFLILRNIAYACSVVVHRTWKKKVAKKLSTGVV